MDHFFEILAVRNNALFIFGCCNMLGAVVFLLMAQFTGAQLRGANAWYKPFKFALSLGTFSWTMGWYTFELNAPLAVNIYSRATILLLGFEIVYISLQAGRGKTSHYNTSSPVYAFLTALMGIAAAIATLWTGYIGLLFCTGNFPQLPGYYVWSIRFGIFLFVIFAFEGASMGARQTHTVGGPEGGEALPILNWSKKYGDLRIAHFAGMHALQILPLLSFFVLKSIAGTVIIGMLYAMLAFFLLLGALKGKPLFARLKTSAMR